MALTQHSNPRGDLFHTQLSGLWSTVDIRACLTVQYQIMNTSDLYSLPFHEITSDCTRESSHKKAIIKYMVLFHTFCHGIRNAFDSIYIFTWTLTDEDCMKSTFPFRIVPSDQRSHKSHIPVCFVPSTISCWICCLNCQYCKAIQILQVVRYLFHIKTSSI